MQSSPVIDLQAPAPLPRRTPRGRRRTLALIGLTISQLLILTGPVHSGPSLTLAWRAEAFAGFVWMRGEAVYSVTRSPDDLWLVSRDIATGRTRWEHRLHGPLVEAYLDRPAILVPRFPPYPGSPTATLVLDAATARQVGRYPVPAAPLAYIGEGVAVMVDRGPGPSEAHWVEGVDLQTGAVRWRRPIAEGSSWALPGVYPWMEGLVGSNAAGRWMAVVDPDGGAEVWELATGEIRARGRLGPFDSWSYAVALPDVLVVNSRALPQMRLTGYDPDSMSVRWRVQLPAAPDVAAWPIECAGPICLHSTHAVWAIDSRTGALRWHQRAVEAYPARFPMLAALTVDGPMLFDVANGAAHRLASGWWIVEKHPIGPQLVVSRVDAGRTLLGALDQRDGRITVLGDVGAIGPPGACHTAGTHVACTIGEALRVWRIRH